MNGSLVPDLVSVVLTVLNGETYIRDALESILAQDYSSFEVIVVDDGSSDGSAAIVDSYSDVILISQENQGTAMARQIGLERARGEYICFFDHDDLMKPFKLSKQVGYLEAHPDVVAVLGRQEILLEPGTDPPKWLWRDPIFGDFGGVQAESALIRMDSLRAIDGYQPHRKMSLGIDVLARLRAVGGRIEILPDVIMQRRIHNENMTYGIQGLQSDLIHTMKDRIDLGRDR